MPAVIALPLLFTAGMTLMDTTDGVVMAQAYGWAFPNPLRKVYYNMATVALGVFVALGVGMIEVPPGPVHQRQVGRVVLG